MWCFQPKFAVQHPEFWKNNIPFKIDSMQPPWCLFTFQRKRSSSVQNSKVVKLNYFARCKLVMHNVFRSVHHLIKLIISVVKLHGFLRCGISKRIVPDEVVVHDTLKSATLVKPRTDKKICAYVAYFVYITSVKWLNRVQKQTSKKSLPNAYFWLHFLVQSLTEFSLRVITEFRLKVFLAVIFRPPLGQLAACFRSSL